MQSYIGVSQQLWSQLSRPLQYIGEIVYLYVYTGILIVQMIFE